VQRILRWHPAASLGWLLLSPTQAVLLLEVVKEDPTRLAFYQDAGQELRAPLHEVYAAIETEGYFFTTSGFPFPNLKWNHPASFRHWGLSTNSREWRAARREAIGGIVGFRGDHREGRGWLEAWVGCNLELGCLSPAGSDRSNHRQASHNPCTHHRPPRTSPRPVV